MYKSYHMKKILSLPFLLAAVAFAVTGCLKDKGFENHEYGINSPEGSPASVGFPLSINANNAVGINVATTVQTISDILVVNFNFKDPAPCTSNFSCN
jgi:hypothetical protein